MIARRRPFALLLTTLALAGAAGCGSGDQSTDDAAGSNGDNELASSDAARVLVAKRVIDAACGDESATSTAAGLQSAVNTLVSLTKSSPDRVYETGNVARATELSTVAKQTADQLRACKNDALADELAAAAKD